MKSVQDLPAGYLDMLHILPAIMEQILLLLFIGLLVLIALFALAYWVLYRRSRKPALLFAPTRDWIGELEKEFEARKDYREGCHALSERAKTWLEEQSGLQVEEMTAREIEEQFKLKGFFLKLAECQYGQRSPEHSDFKRMITLARKNLKGFKRLAPAFSNQNMTRSGARHV